MPDTIDDVDEHPIILNDWSTRRILAGEKTQTRRIVKPQPDLKGVTDSDLKLRQDPVSKEWVVAPIGDLVPSMQAAHGWINEDFPKHPYGQPGSRLWVREEFRLPHTYDEMSPSEYVDEGQPHIVRFEADEGDYNAVPKDGWGRKRPSIHMPRELCRLRLCVEDVRVERVQEINAVDAIAEGIADPFDHTVMPDGIGGVELDEKRRTIHELAFKALWQSIHGDGAWEENSWVWVIEFARYDE
jgi:hypothetical protein